MQSGSHPEPCTFIAVPQSHCSPLSRVPLPQEGLAQRWFGWHVPPFRHAPPLGGDPTTHFCPGEPAEPEVNAVQVFVPAQESGVMQSFGEIVHEKVQSISHPVPMPLFAPKSHCSGASTTPSPQLADTHAPERHT